MKIHRIAGCLARTLFLAGVLLLFPHILKGQSPGDSLSIHVRNATLEEFVRHVEAATHYSFVYSEEIKLASLITLDADKQPLRKILDQAFAKQPITYQITGRHILLRKKTEKPVSRKFTISGYVTDGTSSETLIGANVFESRQQQGTATNPYGFYSLTLPEGANVLHFSYLGYSSHSTGLILLRDTVLNIRLTSDNQLQEVVVISDKVEAGIKATQMSAIDIPMAQIKHTPAVLGEPDVMKTIQLMPGVQSGLEGSAGLHVRGGGPDQNLILLDGIPVYNVDHMFGFFSVFTPEAVKKVTLFKGSFPARFGGRLSSVVDIRTNDGDMKKFHGMFSIGSLTTKLQFEGPIVKNRTAFNISLRRSYVDLPIRAFLREDLKFGYFFYDINAKVNHKFSDRSRLFLSFYNGKDKYFFDETDKNDNEGELLSIQRIRSDVHWGNTIVSGRWNYIFNNKLFSNTTVAYNNCQMSALSENNYQYFEKQTTEYNYRSDYRSGITDWSWQTDFDYTPNPQHRIRFGSGYLYHTFKPEIATARIADKVGDSPSQEVLFSDLANQPIQAHEMTLYAEDNFELGPRTHLNGGLHFSLFNVQSKTYASLQPRISLRHQLGKNVALKAAYTQMNQYVQLLTSTPFSMPTDLWVPVTGDIKPMQAHQLSAGIYFTGLTGWEFSAEAYSKQMKNVLEYKDGITFLGSSSSWDKKVEMGTGRAVGFELMVQKTAGRTTGWMAYAWGKNDRKFPEGSINNGQRFPYKYDRRHNITAVINQKINDRIDVSASWIFNTGGAMTVPQESTAIIRPADAASYRQPVEDANYIESRNNYRLPASHRLNLGVNFNKKTKHGVRTWNFSVYNAYAAQNPNLVYYSPATTYEKAHITQLTFLTFMPSVTYIYKF